GRHHAVARDLGAGERELHAEGVREVASDERHEQAGEEVLEPEDLVVGRPEVLLDEALVSVPMVVGVVGSLDDCVVGHERISPQGRALAVVVVAWAARKAACSSAVSTVMRAPMIPWPMPQISAHCTS